jgi:hypothetical protein
VIFKEKKSTIFSIILRQLEKWENYRKISYQKAPLKTLSIVLLYFEIRTSLLSTLKNNQGFLVRYLSIIFPFFKLPQNNFKNHTS